ncbi:MAG: ferritin-like domain-containing protein [Myxococcota bacterium]
MDLRMFLTRRFMKALLSTPAGRAHLLNQVADAEDNGEASIFDHALAWVSDPKLKKIIDHHRSDEIRHGQILRDRRDATGVKPPPVPDHLKILDRIDAKLGGFFDRPIDSDEGILTAYLVLLVIEERAVTQFGMFIEAFDAVDRATADTFRSIAADEERHLKYCRAVIRQYAPDEAALERRLTELRQMEAEAFLETSTANVTYALEHGLIPGTFDRLFWRVINALSIRSPEPPLTDFASRDFDGNPRLALAV